MDGILAAVPMGVLLRPSPPVESRNVPQVGDFLTFARITSDDTALRRLEHKKAVADTAYCWRER